VDNTQEPPTVLSLCSGYGGIELGIERVIGKINVVAHVEIETYAAANLVAKIEEGKMAPSLIYTDLKTLNYEIFRGKIDIITGGYPCQPFSAAGKRQGSSDPRHLWPYIRGAIDIVRPRYCFFENVEGHITEGLYDVLDDLGGLGFRTTWGIFSAGEVGAPHRRKRVYIMAFAKGVGYGGRENPNRGNGEGLQEPSKEVESVVRGEVEGCGGDTRRRESLADTDSERCKGRLPRGENQGRENFNGHLGRRDSGIPERWPCRPGEQQHEWEEARILLKDNRKTESRLGRTNNGPSNRVDRLRLLGNGVVPQTAELAFRTLMKELNSD